MAKEDPNAKRIAGVFGKLKWERQDAAARSPSLQLLGRSDLAFDALLACPTQPVCPTSIPTFIFHMSSEAQQEKGRGEKKVSSPGEASTAQNSSSPKSRMNHVTVKSIGGECNNKGAPSLCSGEGL